MKKKSDNIYQISRKEAGLTQDEASEKLLISTRSLSDYERGLRRVPDDLVYQMATLYKTDWLGYEHLRTSSKLGRDNLPKLSDLNKIQSLRDLEKLISLYKDYFGGFICD